MSEAPGPRSGSLPSTFPATVAALHRVAERIALGIRVTERAALDDALTEAVAHDPNLV